MKWIPCHCDPAHRLFRHFGRSDPRFWACRTCHGFGSIPVGWGIFEAFA